MFSVFKYFLTVCKGVSWNACKTVIVVKVEQKIWNSSLCESPAGVPGGCQVRLGCQTHCLTLIILLEQGLLQSFLPLHQKFSWSGENSYVIVDQACYMLAAPCIKLLSVIIKKVRHCLMTGRPVPRTRIRIRTACNVSCSHSVLPVKLDGQYTLIKQAEVVDYWSKYCW